MPNGYGGNADAAFFFKLLSDMAGLWMWGLCLWFFIVSVGAHWQVIWPNHPDHRIHFDMTWLVFSPPSLSPRRLTKSRYSFVFPNTALVTATISLGDSLDSRAIKIFGTVLSALLVLVWLFVFSMMIRSLYLKRSLWPGDKDGTEGVGEKWMGDGKYVGRGIPRANGHRARQGVDA
jgi:tellurite resistance protein TehA-like permease